MLRSPQNLKLFLDGLLAGLRVYEASARISGFPSHGTPAHWRRQSRESEAAGDTESDFYFSWPSDTAPRWFHEHYALVKKRRAAMFESEQWQDFKRGRFSVVDGRLAFQQGDFGEILLDDFGMPLLAPIEKVVPRERRMWQARREGRLDPPKSVIGRPRLNSNGSLREHQPAPPVIVNPPSAIAEYIERTNPRRPMTPLEQDLRDRLAAVPKNPRPNAPVKVIRDQPEDSAMERRSAPSDQTDLPVSGEAPDHPARVPPQQKPTIIDYSRGNRARVDTAGVGAGPDPRTLGGSRGFKLG